MASKGKAFSFIKKKEEQAPISNPIQPPQPQLQIQDNDLLLHNTTTPTAPSKGFGFIKKTQSKKDQPPIAQPIEEPPKPSLESLFTNDFFLNITPEPKEEKPQSNINTAVDNNKALDELFSKDNEKIDLVNNNNNNNTPSPKASVSSGSNKKGFSFIKKKDKVISNDNTNTNATYNINPSDNLTFTSKPPLTETSNKQFNININNQYEDNYESQFYTNDKSEQGSVSSKKNKMIMSQKDSSGHSTPKASTHIETFHQQQFMGSNLSSGPNLANELKTNTPPLLKTPTIIKLTDELLRESLREQKNINMTTFNNLISKIHSIKLKLRSLQLELQSQNKQQEKLMSDEQLAIEANDFEKADHIETIIKNLSITISLTEKNIINQIKELLSIRKEELTLITQSTKDTDNNLLSIARLKDICEEEMDSFINNALSKHNSENIRLKKMKEKLHFLKGNLDTEKNYITEEEEKITKVIKTQSSDIFDELDNLNQAKEVLNKEINELKRRLEEKENERDDLNIIIESKESEIEAIKSNFTHDFSKIELKKRNYAENLKDYEEQERNYLNKTDNYSNQDIEYNNRLDKMKEQIASYQSELKDLKNNRSQMNTERLEKEELLKKEYDLFDSCNKIRDEIDKAQKGIKSTNESIQSLHANNKLLENEISQIEIRIPALEEEKKIFVKAKNFKEAGRVSNELKACLEKKNTNIKSIEENKEKISKYETNLGEFNKQISLLTEEKKAKDKNINIIRYDYLNKYLQSLMQYKNNGVNSNDLNQEILFTKEEMQELEGYSYIIATDKTETGTEVMKEEKNDTSEGKNEISNSIEKQQMETDKNKIESKEVKEENCNENVKEENKGEKKQEIKRTREERLNRIDELNKELQQVIVNEDYEAADKIQTEIDKLTEELNE